MLGAGPANEAGGGATGCWVGVTDQGAGVVAAVASIGNGLPHRTHDEAADAAMEPQLRHFCMVLSLPSWAVAGGTPAATSGGNLGSHNRAKRGLKTRSQHHGA